MNRLAVKSFKMLRNVNLAQKNLFSSSFIFRAGGSSHHHSEDNHSHSHHEEPKKFLDRYFEKTESEKNGYTYRKISNLDGNFGLFLSECLMTFLWFWIFYNFMIRPEDFFGHHPYPDTSLWTDAELGIKDE